MSQTFNPDAPLSLKFGIEEAPDIVLFKGKKSNWVSGLDSLMLVLETIEKEQEIRLDE